MNFLHIMSISVHFLLLIKKSLIRIRISKTNRMVKRKRTKDKQRSTKHTHKTKDRVTRTPLKPGGELR